MQMITELHININATKMIITIENTFITLPLNPHREWEDTIVPSFVVPFTSRREWDDVTCCHLNCGDSVQIKWEIVSLRVTIFTLPVTASHLTSLTARNKMDYLYLFDKQKQPEAMQVLSAFTYNTSNFSRQAKANTQQTRFMRSYLLFLRYSNEIKRSTKLNTNGTKNRKNLETAVQSNSKYK